MTIELVLLYGECREGQKPRSLLRIKLDTPSACCGVFDYEKELKKQACAVKGKGGLNMESGGFDFYTARDVRLAEAEQRKIDYLEERIDYTRPESILHVYDKSIQEQIFRTPVGVLYLKKMQDFLLKQPQIDPEKIKAIPLYDTYAVDQKTEEDPNNPSPLTIRKREAAKTRFQISVVLNVLLILAICAMFVISFNSDQPNIYNYERLLQDRYASWEQELTQREQTIREKERELNVDSTKLLQNE